MPRGIADSVVVITGASSGIGRATALAFAQEHAKLVLAARREDLLHEAVAECEEQGANALAVRTDVTDAEAVEQLASKAVDRFGRIDTWVNNAGVMEFGRFEETPPEVFRRVIDTNLFGYIHGTRAALPIFREYGGGVLINIGSVVAETGQPYTSAYVVSKYAVRGLGVSLREELSVDGNQNIYVCTVMPATVDTPIFQHAANYSGRAVKAIPPVYPAKRVAQSIVGCARKPRPEIFVGNAARMLQMEHKVAPQLTERQMARMTDRMQLDRQKVAPQTNGNLFEPIHEGNGISGGWNTLTGIHQNDRKMRRSTLQRGLLYSGALAAGALMGALIGTWE